MTRIYCGNLPFSTNDDELRGMFDEFGSPRKVLRLADEFFVDLDRVVGELRMALGHDAVVL